MEIFTEAFEDLLSSQAYGILLAGLLGAFLGLRREIQEKDKNGFMGLRTMTLIAMLGAVSTMFASLPYLPAVAFIALLVLVGVAYAHGVFIEKKVGLTAEMSALMTFWVGVLSATNGMTSLAILLAVILAVLDAYKKEMQNFSNTLNAREWRGALQLLIFSAIVLPVLPQEAIDPWGVIVPYNVWFLILLISGIGFLGYLASKYLGERVGILLTAFLGALSSSTAVTISLSEKAARDAKKTNDVHLGLLIAVAVMQARVMVILGMLGGVALGYKFFLVPLAMIAIEMIFLAFHWYNLRQAKARARGPKPKRRVVQSDLELESPFDIMPAMKFGLVFVLVSLAVYFGQSLFGNSGVYFAAFLSGIVDVDAMVLSALESLKRGDLALEVVYAALTIALVMNTLVKVFYAWVIGTQKLALKILPEVVMAGVFGGLVCWIL